MKPDLTKKYVKPPAAGPSRARLFLAALGANWLTLAGIAALYALLAAGAYGLRRVMKWSPMDIAFVFDTTGSMREEMAGTVRTARRFVDRLSQSGVSCRLALVAFGAKDEEQPVVRASLQFTGDVARFRQVLGGLKAEGGGQEDHLTALDHSLHSLSPRPGTEVTYILITDEPYNLPSKCGKTFNQIKDQLKGQGVRVYAVTAAEDAGSTEDFRRLAEESGGAWYDIHGASDFTDILQHIAEHIATSIVR